MTAKFSQQNLIVPANIPVAASYDAGFTAESVNMAKYGHVTAIMMGDAACAGSGVVTVNAGTALAGADAQVTFTYRTIAADTMAATLSDVLSTPATSASLALTEANILSGMYVFEWDASDLNIAGVQYQYATLVLSAAGTAGFVTLVYILSEPRYEKNIMPTATV
jgi:hypothetical protein